MFMASLPEKSPSFVMPGLVPGIHVFCSRSKKQDVDGRDKPGQDGAGGRFIALSREVAGDQA
jgi:hypothetical protein